MEKKDFYTTGDVSQIVNISRATVSRKFDEGIFYGKKNPITGERLISHESLAAFMSQYGLSLEKMKDAGPRRPRPRSSSRAAAAAPESHKAILIGSTDTRIRDAVMATFSGEQRISVESATSGYDALIMASKHTPDLFILDEELPGISCGDAVRSLRKIDDDDNMKILCILSAFDPEKVVQIGADDYLSKDALEELTPARKKGLIGFMFGKITGDNASLEKYESEYLKASKPESLGILTSRIANDFNNMLTSIFGNISLAKTLVADRNEVYDILTEAESASQLAMKLTNYLFTYKTGEPKKAPMKLSGIIEEAVDFSLRGSTTRCEFEIPDDLPEIEADREQIGQVLNNIIMNADQAMPEGGVIEIGAELVDVGPDDNLSLDDGEYVCITVRDHGIGIPEEYLPKIFDPYFTTKPRVSGLGLSTANSIVKKHNGHITVESTVGEGSQFHIYLPTQELVQEIPVTEGMEGEKKKVSSGRILVVDDEPSVRKVLSRMIEHIGHRYTTVSDGEEAIKAYRKAIDENDRYDAIIMDLTMPGGMGGREAIGKILEVDPKARAIASSGNTDDTAFTDYRTYGFKGVIPKPYELKQLEIALTRILG